MRPYDARTEKHMLNLRATVHPTDPGKWGLSIDYDGAVRLMGPMGKEDVFIPRDQFNDIVRWYMRDQKEPA